MTAWGAVSQPATGTAMDGYLLGQTYGSDMMATSDLSFIGDPSQSSMSTLAGGGAEPFSDERPDWQVRLDFDWFPPLLQQKLVERKPFVQHEWSTFMTVIFDHFFTLDCTQPRNPRQWYTDMTALIVETYPHLFGDTTLPQRLAFMRNKLIHKFKNGRFKVQTSMRPRTSMPKALYSVPGSSFAVRHGKPSAEQGTLEDPEERL